MRRPRPILRVCLAATSWVTLLAVASGPAAATPLKITASYAGSGEYATTYHSEPPDGGGKHDTDYAHDSETQRWSLRFTQPISRTPACSSAGCTLTATTGTTAVRAQIFHHHHDGLFSDENSQIRCRIHSATSTPVSSGAQLIYRFTDGGRLLEITLLDPVARALLKLPTACPGQGDSLDGLLDNYLGPGFSFASGWGPVPWFTSPTVIVPVAGLTGAHDIRIPVRLTGRGTPPRNCAVPDSWQRCQTGGSWSGALTLSVSRAPRAATS